MESIERLDSEELLHLALRATKENKTEDSIEYLKRSIELSPKFGKAYYLLGALHAEIGLYDRAIEEMTKAIELEPSISAAHFQLGLLYMTSGQVEQARETWKALDEYGETHPFWLFKEGMLHLAADDFERSIELLSQGIALNKINPALNKDMQNVIERTKAALANTTQEQPKPDGKSDTQPTEESEKIKKRKHVLLSAYKNQDEDTTH